MKKILLITFLLFGITCFGQAIPTPQDLAQATIDITKRSKDFEAKNIEFLAKEKDLNNYIANISASMDPAKTGELSTKVVEVQNKRKELNESYLLFETYKKVYMDKGIPEKTINNLFKYQYTVSDPIVSTNNVDEPETYLYFGKDQILQESKLTNNEEVNEILKTVLKEKSESYLGDIIIPKENQQFAFYDDKFNVKSGRYYKFKRVTFEIQDGFFTDIKVFVFDENGSELLFENKIPISILRYSTQAPKNFLFFKHAINQNGIVDFKKTENLRIRLSDVLMYVSRPGYNFIPNDVTFDFPTKENGIYLNKESSIKYEIKEDTSLQNVVELRAYTDFLGLFADSPNGVVQLQGKGDFYVFPFSMPFWGWDLKLLDKISPYVNFSRIDADSRAVETTVLPDSKNGIKNSLDLLQKAYLEMGTKVNVVNFKFGKEYPFRTIFYFPIRYQISDVKISNELTNVQGLGLGGGVTFEFKRFNNFGFSYSLEYSSYKYINFNKIPTFEAPEAFNVFRNEAEVYYHPDKDKKQAIFLRFRTFNNAKTNEAFYQLQFGYRFSIGISDVKAKTQ